MISRLQITVEPWFYDKQNTFVLKFKIEKFGEEDLHYERAMTYEHLELDGWFDHMINEAVSQLKLQG